MCGILVLQEVITRLTDLLTFSFPLGISTPIDVSHIWIDFCVTDTSYMSIAGYNVTHTLALLHSYSLLYNGCHWISAIVTLVSTSL